MKIEEWTDLIPILNKGVKDICGQGWGEGPLEMILELNDGSQIDFTFCVHISHYGISGDVDIEYIEPLNEDEEDLKDETQEDIKRN